MQKSTAAKFSYDMHVKKIFQTRNVSLNEMKSVHVNWQTNQLNTEGETKYLTFILDKKRTHIIMKSTEVRHKFNQYHCLIGTNSQSPVDNFVIQTNT